MLYQPSLLLIHNIRVCCLFEYTIGAHRLGRIVGVLLLRHGVKQQLAQLENRLKDCEVAQFRWWAWASRYRRRKVRLFSYGMPISTI